MSTLPTWPATSQACKHAETARTPAGGERVPDCGVGVEGEARSEVLPHLSFVVVGHVDHGKSTLIGRLLFDTRSVADGVTEQIQQACKTEGMDFEYAYLLDALLEEQAQNVTMDTTRVPFRTANRAYSIIDSPGHTEFLKNMITGAASAHAAVLIVDASEGLREQTRRHGYLLSLLGLKQIVVAVNKMDLVNYDAAVFARIEAELMCFLGRLHLEAAAFVPTAAKYGEGLLERSSRMPWYRGPALLESLERFRPQARTHGAPLRLIVQDVYRFDQRRIIAGFVEAGELAVGDMIEFHPGNKRSRVKTIERWPASLSSEGGRRRSAAVRSTEEGLPHVGPNRAGAASSCDDRSVPAGRSVAVTLDEELYVERGYVGAELGQPPQQAREFDVRVFWLHGEPLRVGDVLPLRLGTQEVEARLVAVARVLDAISLDASAGPATEIKRHEVAEARIRVRRPIIFEPASAIPALGRFVLMRGGRISGGGVIDAAVRETTAGEHLPTSRAAHESLLGHCGAVIWLTGLSGAGKSTLATALERYLLSAGLLPVILDGDVLRAGLCQDLGFSEADRKENIRRAAEAALLIAESGAIVITALISPYRADRQLAAERCIARSVPFAEVYVNAPLAECERRDVKHLYRRARAGEIPTFTGISSPYEPPLRPALALRTDRESVEQSLEKLAKLAMQLALRNA